ncbi:hypothetical protein ACJRO7_022086 [Eucalyptus globulus]|uniref:Calcium-transporting ATPase n=1 Tax=Eucalyptus globulus TaxID=34317 RepID=A0ABD3KPD7_EUCGL
MSQKSFADDLDIESQQKNLLVDAGGAPRRRWQLVSSVLRANSILISITKKTLIRASAVDDQDVESQQPTRLNTGKTLRRRWHLVYLVVKALRGFVSTANNPVMETQLDSAELLEPEPISERHIDWYNNHEAADVVTEIARMTKEKNLSTLQEFGGVPGVAEALGSDMVKGIPGHEKDRHARSPALLRPKPEVHNRNFIHFLRKSFNSSTIFLLLIFAILSFAFGIKEKGLRTGWYEGALTLAAVILIVIVRSICEFRNESSRHLSRNQLWQNGEMEVQVLRGGCRQTICISDVLLGDIVLLEKEDRVPADGLLIPTESLEVDDKADPIINDQNPFLFYGSIVTHGTGKMLVTSVGAETKWGVRLSGAPLSQGTTVEKQLNKLSTLIQVISIVNSVIIAVVLFLRFKLEKKHEKSGLPDFSGKPQPLKELIEAIERVALKPRGMLNMLTSFTLLLVGIAEGMPLAITIAITRWNKKMLGDKMFAQVPCCIVTMASVTTICTDETAVLTLIPQEVAECWIGKEELIRENPKITVDVQDAALPVKEGGNGPRFLHCKGPATPILDLCSQFYDTEGKTRTLNISEKRYFENRINQMQSEGLESIAFACKQVDDSGIDEGNLKMVGLLGLKNTGQEDNREVINFFREAGIKVLLASSKGVSMLEDIATAIGVIQPDSDAQVITGKEFQKGSDEGRMDMITRISVMGNSCPSDIDRLVSCLKDQGHTVAVVGDTTNDVPTLKAADVGLTFATRSTEIARESSDIVIREGNFTSILAIINCGRCIYSNIRKYIQFQLTMTLAGSLIPLITNASHGSSPITTIQFHWAISVLTPLGGLALLMEPPREMLMKKFTLGRDEQLITKAMWVNVFIQTAYQASLFATIQSKGPAMLRLNEKPIGTLIFNSFFLCQLSNMFNAREPENKNIFRKVHRSKWFWMGTVTALLLQFTFFEIAHIIAGDSRLTYAEWGMCLLPGIISWCIDLAGKCICLMIKSCVTKPPGSVVRDNGNLTSADPEPAGDLELPLMQEVEGPTYQS